jgi:hypothetical protein
MAIETACLTAAWVRTGLKYYVLFGICERKEKEETTRPKIGTLYESEIKYTFYTLC